jgi:hypothetical protein
MAKTETVHSMLLVGKRLTAGRVREVAELLLAQPKRANQVAECLWDEDAGVANRAADALERASCKQPAILAPCKEALLGRMVEATENKLRWNLALIAPRLKLTVPETERIAGLLRPWLGDRSSIVKTCTMQGLAGRGRQNPSLLPEVLDLLRILTRSGTPAMRARGRILLRGLERIGDQASPGRKQPRRSARLIH